MSGFNSKHWLILSLSFFSAAVLAETKQWTGAVNSNWSEPGNWSSTGVPLATDNVTWPNAGSTEIVVDTDSSADSPAAATMVLGSNTKAADVTISGGHTLYLKADSGVGYKVTEQANSIVKVSGSGTKAYFMTPTDATNIKSYFVRFNGGGLCASGGAYAEIAACQFSKIQAVGADNNGVRSKIKYGWAQNGNYSAATTIADGGDIEFDPTYLAVKVKGTAPIFIARNGGTNDMSRLGAWQSGNNPHVYVENGGVVLLPNISAWNSADVILSMSNGTVRLGTGFGYNSTGNAAKLIFQGAKPQLYVTGSDNGNSCTVSLGKADAFDVDIRLEPTSSWASISDGLIWNAGISYIALTTNTSLTIDVSGLSAMVKDETLTFPLLGTNPSSTNGIVVPKVDNVEIPLSITLVGSNSDQFEATCGSRSGDKRHYDVRITRVKAGTAKGLCIVFF